MKRKPILAKKLAKDGKERLREVIGLIGVHGGVGVTYTGLMLAFYLGEELGRRTAFLECNSHKDLELIRMTYEWSSEDAAAFRFRNITCYKNVSPGQIAAILGESYEYVLIDFGTDFADNREEFLRCSRKVVVAGRSEWGLQKLLSWIRSYGVTRGSEHWHCLIPLAEERALRRMKQETPFRVWSVPYTEEPTRLNRNTRQFFKELLRLA